MKNIKNKINTGIDSFIIKYNNINTNTNIEILYNYKVHLLNV